MIVTQRSRVARMMSAEEESMDKSDELNQDESLEQPENVQQPEADVANDDAADLDAPEDDVPVRK
jgi:hypothetical protein